MRDKVWSWLMDPGHEVEGIVGLDEAGRAVGLAHYRAFARPLSAMTCGFLDDLFVAETARASGAADTLTRRIRAIGRECGWSVIRRITAEDNALARNVYDRLARKTDWVTYDFAP